MLDVIYADEYYGHVKCILPGKLATFQVTPVMILLYIDLCINLFS